MLLKLRLCYDLYNMIKSCSLFGNYTNYSTWNIVIIQLF